MTVVIGSPGSGAGQTTLQRAYENSGGVNPMIQLAIADGTLTIRDDATPLADMFALQNNAGTAFLRADATIFDYGLNGNRGYELQLDPTGREGIRFLPDGRTQTTTALVGAAITWDSLVIADIPGGAPFGNDTAPAMIASLGECRFDDPAFLFATSLLFNQATTLSANGFNLGPVYTMVNQPTVRNVGGGSVTTSQANAVRSQFRVGPNTSGNMTVVSHEPFFATALIDATVGTASITTCNYFAPKAPTFTAGGTIGTLNVMDIPNIPAAGITTLRGINSAMNNGTFINHTGTAESDFFGQINFPNEVIGITYGSSGDWSEGYAAGDYKFEEQNVGPGGQFRKDFPAAGRMRMDWDVDTELTVNCVDGFSLGAQLGGNGNTFGAFVTAANRQAGIAGEWSDFLLTQGGNLDVNGFALSNVSAWTINAINATLSGGSITNNAVLRVAGNPDNATNRYGLWIQSNPSGGSGDNYPLYVENGTSRIENLITGDPGTEGSGITIGGALFDSALKVSGLGGGDQAQLIMHRHSTSFGPVIVGARANNDTAAHTIVADGQETLSVVGVGWDGTDYERSAAIRFRIDGTPGAGDMPGRIDFETTPNGTAALALALRINQAQRCDFQTNQALGGGAAATLGTIGGSGPTAAAQAQWLEIEIGGVVHWVPAWT